ncbi:MAG TPA: 5'-nucleotidase C-terminal domain-containing protein, partial [Pyrinomonadaceae bacterium]|nr:5'-nucleotidase C-terminal domain-containing protein [Pyrinomonadaceae bacterium]
GSRVVDVSVNGVPLDDQKKYSLATTNFLAEGGDGYDVLKTARVLIAPAQGQTDFDVVRQSLATGPITPKVDGRIKRLDNTRRKQADCPE